MSVRCFVALGDSFTAGSEPGVASFCDRVAVQLPDARYLNLAAAGARSADVVDQLDGALAAEPDLVTVVCGANDVVRTTRPDVEAFERNLTTVLAALSGAPRPPRVVSATYPAVAELLPLRARTRARVDEGLRAVNDVIRRLSDRHGAYCLELDGHPGRAERENFAADGFHPSAAGHRRAALALAACLRERLDIDIEPVQEEAAA